MTYLQYGYKSFKLSFGCCFVDVNIFSYKVDPLIQHDSQDYLLLTQNVRAYSSVYITDV